MSNTSGMSASDLNRITLPMDFSPHHMLPIQLLRDSPICITNPVDLDRFETEFTDQAGFHKCRGKFCEIRFFGSRYDFADVILFYLIELSSKNLQIECKGLEMVKELVGDVVVVSKTVDQHAKKVIKETRKKVFSHLLKELERNYPITENDIVNQAKNYFEQLNALCGSGELLCLSKYLGLNIVLIDKCYNKTQYKSDEEESGLTIYIYHEERGLLQALLYSFELHDLLQNPQNARMQHAFAKCMNCPKMRPFSWEFDEMVESLLIGSVNSGFDVPSVFLNDFTYLSSLSEKFPESKAFRYLSKIKPNIVPIREESNSVSIICGHCKQELAMNFIYKSCRDCAVVMCIYCACNWSLPLPRCCTIPTITVFPCPGCGCRNRNSRDFICVKCPNHPYLCKKCWMMMSKNSTFTCPVDNCSTIFDQRSIDVWKKFGLVMCFNCRRIKIRLYSEFPCKKCSVCIDCQPDIKRCIYCKVERTEKDERWSMETTFVPELTKT